MSKTVQFWFDVSCPFCWLTSRWMKEVEKVRDISVEWIPMSLSVLNDGRDLPEDYAEKMKANWGPARVSAKIKAEAPELIDQWYTTIGTLIHTEGNGGKQGFGAYDAVIAEALRRLGLDESFAAVANEDSYDEKLRAYHHSAMDKVGDDVGTPVVGMGKSVFFGPVITRVPTGEEAGELFDAAVRLGEYPYFFEMKRSRTEGPQV